MKKIISLFIIAVSLNAIATEKELSADASAIAGLLLDSQLSSCVAELQKKDAVVVKITKEEVSNDEEIVRISAITLIGGDVVNDSLTMTINTTYKPFGFGKTAIHNCKIEVRE